MDRAVREQLKAEVDAVMRLRLEVRELSPRVAALEGEHVNVNGNRRRRARSKRQASTKNGARPTA